MDTVISTRLDLGACPTCHKWALYVGAYDRHGQTVRCHGCLRVPGECWCR